MTFDKLVQFRDKRISIEGRLPWPVLGFLRMGYFTCVVYILTGIAGRFLDWAEFDLTYTVICGFLYAWASKRNRS